MHLNKIFYTLKPFIPRNVQLLLRRKFVHYKRQKYSDIWPIDYSSAVPPDGWSGWPENNKFALIISHDVDTQKGHDACRKLMDIEEKIGFRSCFNIVPERYHVSQSLIEEIKQRGFEVGVHGLNHDGTLFFSETIFDDRVKKINMYLKKWGSSCFTSPSMHHNLDWMYKLNITHGTSTFDTDPFEPQPDAIGTIFPLYFYNHRALNGYVELPYTLPQDFTLFVLLKEKTIKVWKEKLEWVVSKGGMALFNSHPDYMNFSNKRDGAEEYPIKRYTEFLEYIKSKYSEQYWHVLPREIAGFWLNKNVDKQKETY
jgi:peptidoglycan/xylan/chitin deacetylase (PgdA/CDA1 family)